MIGMIHLQLGNIDAAIDVFIRGLHASVKTREQELALTYEIGDAYEQRRAPIKPSTTSSASRASTPPTTTCAGRQPSARAASTPA